MNAYLELLKNYFINLFEKNYYCLPKNQSSCEVRNKILANCGTFKRLKEELNVNSIPKEFEDKIVTLPFWICPLNVKYIDKKCLILILTIAPRIFYVKKYKEAIWGQYIDILNKSNSKEDLFLNFQKQYFKTIVDYKNSLNAFVISLIVGLLTDEPEKPNFEDIDIESIRDRFDKMFEGNLIRLYESIEEQNVIILFKDVFSCDIKSCNNKKPKLKIVPKCFEEFYNNVFSKIIGYVDKIVIITLGSRPAELLQEFIEKELKGKLITNVEIQVDKEEPEKKNARIILMEFPRSKNAYSLLGLLLARQIKRYCQNDV